MEGMHVTKYSGILLLALACCACKKQVKMTACTGHCADIVFAGRVMDVANNTPIAGRQASVTMLLNGCIVCTTIDVASGKTGSDGNFRFQVTIDTSLLKDHHLVMSINAPADYLLYPKVISPAISATPGSVSESFYTIDTAAFGHFNAGFYPVADLSVRLHRATPVVSAYPVLSMDLRLEPTGTTSVAGLYQSAANIDTTFHIQTAANSYTKITTTKWISPTAIQNHTDSVKCAAGQNNTIDITY